MLKLYMHPLASYCQKVLIALYENATPFEPVRVDLFEERSAAAFKKLWPIGKMPVLRDDDRNCTVAESSIIIEYLGQYYPGRTKLVPTDPDRSRETRFVDRFYDLYVHEPMQKIVDDRIRPAGTGDPYGVEMAKKRLVTAYDMIEADMAKRTWAAGSEFSLADCAAAPPLFFANKLVPFGEARKNLDRYYRQLMQHSAVARTAREAEPFMKLFPG
jgi:glutathione S-transferase